MKTQLKNLAGLFKDTRTRTIIIFTGVVILFAIIVGIVRLTKTPEGPAANAQVQGAPGIQSIPGGFDQATTAEYARLQEQQNELQAKIAAQQGTSAIPTIIRASSFEQQTKTNTTTGCCNPCPCPGATAGKTGLPPLQPSALAPGTLVYDAQGRVIGTIGADGKVRDSSGKILGTVGPDGLVRDINGNVIGAAAAATGTPVYDAQGKLIGTVGADGKVRDAQGNVIGQMDADGTVRDFNGNVIGKAGMAAQGVPVYDAQGRLIGNVGADGKVRDAQGNVIGTVDSDGTVRDANGKIIGKAISSTLGTPVYDAQGRLIGTVGADGKVRDAQGNVIGTVGPDGTVRDENGKIIGKASSSAPGTPVYDAQGRLIGVVGADGKVHDANGKVIGTVGPDGIVRDMKGNVIGKASSIVPGAPVYDAQGRLIGTVGADGKVRDANGKVIGIVGPDGVVRDADGNVIGKTGATVPGTPIYDAQGRLIGMAGSDGIVRDSSGRAIGTLGLDGNVRDIGNQIIGSTAAGGREATTVAQVGGQLSAIPSIQSQEQNPELQAILQKQAAQISEQQAEQVKAQMQGAIAGQANQLLASWVSPAQQYVAGNAETGKSTEDSKTAGSAAGSDGGVAPVVKAGTIMYAVLMTAVNSDEPGPVLATIVDGKFKGGRLLGALSNQGQKVLLSFNTLTLPNISKSISINVVAIDQNTARTAFSSYTDNHYLLRYGTLFASSFLQGYGEAYQTSGQKVVSLGLEKEKVNPDLDPKGKFFVALGKVGDRYSSVLNQVFNTPPTVYVNSGTAMGILFLSDVPPLPA